MPEDMVTRILRLPGYGVYAWEAEEVTGVDERLRTLESELGRKEWRGICLC